LLFFLFFLFLLFPLVSPILDDIGLLKNPVFGGRLALLGEAHSRHRRSADDYLILTFGNFMRSVFFLFFPTFTFLKGGA
jgi:hypothetical protein